jgi:uncharacterized protein with HEPN domain
MLTAAEDARAFVDAGQERVLAAGREGMMLQRGLRNCVYEFCEMETKLTGPTTNALDLDWTKVRRMRFDLAHDYPEVISKELLAFGREVMIPSIRRLRALRLHDEPGNGLRRE